jgi:hypothetical protein
MKGQPLRFDRSVIGDILDGKKVQARRILKPQPPESTVGWLREIGANGKWIATDAPSDRPVRRRVKRVDCPYGEPGKALTLYDDANVPFAEATLIGLRIQRLQDISEGDVAAEGCAQNGPRGAFLPGMPLKSMFAMAWCESYGARAWAANPWVWVLEFRMRQALPYVRQPVAQELPLLDQQPAQRSAE